MSNASPASRISAFSELKLLAEGLRNLGTAAVQRRLHDECAAQNITALDLHHLQSEWNGVQDHLDRFMEQLELLRNETLDEAWSDKISSDSDSNATHCGACFLRLELNADGLCSACGNA
jgi:hypothetical protein